jgi:phage baseplate assembly protein W
VRVDDIDFPYYIDRRGRTALSHAANHVRDLIEQVLFTSPGERVMRPDFGSGLLAMVFEPNSTALAATSQMLIQGALQQHLGHLIAVQSVEVKAIDSTFHVEVRYALLADGMVHLDSFAAPGAPT